MKRREETSGARAPFWRRASPIVVLALLPLVAFAGPASLARAFFYYDVQCYFYPYHVMAASMIRSGTLPLWNPYTMSGIPLLGDGQTALLYPPNWLFLVMPGWAALTYDTLLQFSLAGVGAYLFGRGLRLRTLPSFVGAIAYMFSGFMTARAIHLSILSGAALLPWVLAAVDRLASGGGRRWLVAAAGAIALQACCGHPQVPCYTVLAVALLGGVRAAERWRGGERAPAVARVGLAIAGAYALGLALAGLQLVPWGELISFSPRAAGASYEFVTGHSMQARHWLLLLFPYAYGSLGAELYGKLPGGGDVELWEHSGYAGILPLGLAAIALADLVASFARSPAKGDAGASTPPRALPPALYPAALLVLGALIAAAARTPFGRLLYATPLIGKLRDVERALSLVDFAIAVLAMIGCERLLAFRRTSDGGSRVPLLAGVAVALAPAVFLAAVAAGALGAPASARLDLQHANALVPLALALASAALLGAFLLRPAGRVARGALVALVAIDMTSYAAAFHPTIAPAELTRRPDVLDAFAGASEPFRKATILPPKPLELATLEEVLAISWGMPWGIEDVEGFNSLQPRRYLDYLYSPSMEDVSYGLLRDPKLLNARSRILDSLNVRYFLFPREMHVELPASEGSRLRLAYGNDRVDVVENLRAFPRAYFVDEVRAVPDRAAVLAAVEPVQRGEPPRATVDTRHVALLETDHAPALAPVDPASPAEVAWDRALPDRLELTTRTDAPRLLVLSEMFFPGWRATVDGVETEIFRANYLFRGIVVPPGRHAISFVYRPASVVVGAALSAVASLVAVALARRPRRRGQRAAP